MASAEGSRRAVKGLSGAAFRGRFGTEAACRTALFAMRWREGLTCPACGGRGFCALTTRKVFQCNRCKKQVSLTAGTVFQDTKLPLVTWFAAVYQLTQSKGGISSIELARRLGVRQPTAWLAKHKLMRAMAAREAGKPQLSGLQLPTSSTSHRGGYSCGFDLRLDPIRLDHVGALKRLRTEEHDLEDSQQTIDSTGKDVGNCKPGGG